MKVLIIPDVHLKPWIFSRASDLMKEKAADQAVCLMDIPDDWNQQFNIDLYIQTFDSAIAFAKAFPDTLWCYGNHDVCYPWNQRETGYSAIAQWTVCEKLRVLQETLLDDRQLQYLHRVDNVLFSHGGLADEFVRRYVPARLYNDVDAVVNAVNDLAPDMIWQDLSPIWFRPQNHTGRMYKPRKILQVVGHTPVEQIEKSGNVISCDVFSTYRDGSPIGTQEFLLLDTESWEYRGIK